MPLLCDSTPEVIKNTTPADGSGQLSATSVRPAIDYPSAGGHKWPVIIWLRNIFPTSDLSLGVNQINPRRALQSMTLQLPMTCSSCTALLLHHWYVGRRDDKRGRWSLWFKSRPAGRRVAPDKYTTKKSSQMDGKKMMSPNDRFKKKKKAYCSLFTIRRHDISSSSAVMDSEAATFNATS